MPEQRASRYELTRDEAQDLIDWTGELVGEVVRLKADDPPLRVPHPERFRGNTITGTNPSDR